MLRPSDEQLIAYLDGELDARARDAFADALTRDPALKERADAFADSAKMLRAGLDEVMREEVPERLLEAAHGKSATVIDFVAERARKLGLSSLPRGWGDRRWWFGGAVAASLLCLLIGAGGGYVAANSPEFAPSSEAAAAPANNWNWLDNIAGYHQLLINAGAKMQGLVDVPPDGDSGRKDVKRLPADFHLPNLKPWGLDFQGARYLVIEGRPATQLFYTTDNKKLGPITLVVGSSSKPDLAPDFVHRDDMNFVYWRHNGHAFALVGTAEIGYLWNMAKDISWQIDVAM
jgi:anti-sigma factor RsiW